MLKKLMDKKILTFYTEMFCLSRPWNCLISYISVISVINISIFLLWWLFCSAEQNHLCKFVKEHFGEHFCEIILLYLHFRSNPLMHLWIFATVHSQMNCTNLIDSCQAHLPIQYASNIELIGQKWYWCCDWPRATPESHMQNKPLVCSHGCPCSSWLFHFSIKCNSY